MACSRSPQAEADGTDSGARGGKLPPARAAASASRGPNAWAMRAKRLVPTLNPSAQTNASEQPPRRGGPAWRATSAGGSPTDCDSSPRCARTTRIGHRARGPRRPQHATAGDSPEGTRYSAPESPESAPESTAWNPGKGHAGKPKWHVPARQHVLSGPPQLLGHRWYAAGKRLAVSELYCGSALKLIAALVQLKLH